MLYPQPHEFCSVDVLESNMSTSSSHFFAAPFLLSGHRLTRTNHNKVNKENECRNVNKGLMNATHL